MGIATTKVSSRGQVVIPSELRSQAGLKAGETLLVFGDKNGIILKKAGSSLEEFEKLAYFGKEFAKQKSIRKRDVLKDD